MPMIYVALGSNRHGAWGAPGDCIQTAFDRLDNGSLCRVLKRSPLYRTSGLGPGRPPPFVNAVVQAETHMPPSALLKFLKRLERRAGPRSSMPWGPRSLDLDIIDYGGVVRGWRGFKPVAAGYRTRGTLVLPHPMAHLRPFVLQPLTDVAQNWRHPVFRLGALELLARVAGGGAGKILEKLD